MTEMILSFEEQILEDFCLECFAISQKWNGVK